MEVSPRNAGTIDSYSQLSDAFFDSLGPEGDFGRRVLLNPTIFRLLGDVDAKTVLDAGCGHGYRYLQRDLSALGDVGGSFDAVVANMVYLDIPDWRSALANCISSLKVGATLVYSLHHPVWLPGQFGAWAERGVVEVRDYLNEHEQLGGHAPNFHRPLSLYVNETIRLGCTIVEFVEPQLQRDQIESPEQEIFMRIPNYIVVAARRDR